MMVELARELKKQDKVHLGRVAKITGLSVNYLAQLAMPLKNNGLLIGVSGKHGGYQLAKDPRDILISDIIQAVQGPISLTDCAKNPDICLNASFCEARMIWVILSGNMMETLEKYTLADLIDKDRVAELRQEYSHLPLIDPDRIMAAIEDSGDRGCPVKAK
jgi:Rrf2 family protein